MTTIPYDMVDQADMRLRNTVILVHDKPVEVLSCKKAGKSVMLQFTYLPKRTVVDEIDVTDEAVNMRDLKLGYVNFDNEALYLTRIPARQQQQGLSGRNISIPNYSADNPAFKRGHIAADFERLKASASFADALTNVYPTFQEAIVMLDQADERVSVAFSRVFALKKDKELEFFELHYKAQRIAWGDPNNFNLPSSSRFLSEILDNSRINFRR
jgi:hypothetical protein